MLYSLALKLKVLNIGLGIIKFMVAEVSIIWSLLCTPSLKSMVAEVSFIL